MSVGILCLIVGMLVGMSGLMVLMTWLESSLLPPAPSIERTGDSPVSPVGVHAQP